MREEEFVRGRTQYELSNHLGNVLVTISDNRVPVDDGTYDVITICPSCLPGYPCQVCYNEYIPVSGTADGIIDYYTAVVLTANDYYPFGMGMPGRKYSANGAYRYGFNGKENDNEVKGEGNQQDYGMRIYDPRLGRFLSVDPLTPSYPWYTPYQFSGNSPIWASDLDGLEPNKRTFQIRMETSGRNNSPTKNQTQAVVVKQYASSNGTPVNLLDGAADNLSDQMEMFSSESLASGWENLKGLVGDFGGMAVGSSEAIESFNQRVLNGSLAVSNGLTEPVMFVATMHQRSWRQNLYGIGYYTTGVLTGIILDRIFGTFSVSKFPGDSYIKKAFDDGVNIQVATVDDLKYMNARSQKASYITGENGRGTILIRPDVTRAAVIEEAIHHHQVKVYGETYFYEHRIELEIQAQDELLKIGEIEGWNQVEIDEIRKAKAIYEKQLKRQR